IALPAHRWAAAGAAVLGEPFLRRLHRATRVQSRSRGRAARSAAPASARIRSDRRHSRSFASAPQAPSAVGHSPLSPIEPKVMLIEDDLRLSELVRTYLQSNGFQVSVEERGDRVVERVQREHPDIIILDLGLPGQNGFT